MTPEVHDMDRWPLEPESPSGATPETPLTTSDGSAASPWTVRPVRFERGRGLRALRRGPLQPGLFSGLPWLALCVLAVVALPVAGQGMATAFLVVGFVGLAVLFTLRIAEWGVSVLHLWDRRQAARRELGLHAPGPLRRRTRDGADRVTSTRRRGRVGRH